MSKVIFVDVDGPMIPVRAYWLPGQTKPASVFDPVAVSLLNKLIEDSGAQIVISSTWRMRGRKIVVALLKRNNIDPAHLHEDWETPLTWGGERAREISLWLEDHPEVTHYVAIEDEEMHVESIPSAVKADAYEGLSYRNYLEARMFLHVHAEDEIGVEAQKRETEMVTHLKRKEVERVARRGSAKEYLAQTLAIELMPYPEDE
jgi:hypothetical protein